ncbi:hypothetical protein CTA2_5813 [Colletotrichum tanaceti]|uniref:Chromo domain-containing protein n=1 Tax=Colletotrichum tanaceti TaxID=1306861 RepID=A0A4U6XAS3_9PEZI|nr:hypothetical protein CTA2_5813 [Colletotrichum tanaceti]TKW50797.1 hypothetical protein CTA1_6625 [Colletotrichum tanaceti]
MDVSGLFVAEDGAPDDDAISINSTLVSEHDSDEEWSVEGIRYQTREGGKDKYLVEWTGYSMEEATWEPEENVTDELLQEWRDTEAKQARGEVEPFDIVAWQKAVDRRHEEHYQRHLERNLERQRRGLQVNLWSGETKADYYVSDEDVSEDDYNAIIPPPKPVERQTDTKPIEDIQPKKSLKQAARPVHRKRATTEEKSMDSAEPPTKKKASSPVSQPRSQSSSLTSAANGFLGAAKKSTASKPAANAAVSRLAAPTASAWPAHKTKNTAISSRTMVRSQNSGSGINVFAAGKQSRQRRQLVQNVADPAKDPRMFTNFRLRRKAELQSRDKADVESGVMPTKLFSIRNGPPAGSIPDTSSGTSSTVLRSALKHSADGLTAISTSDSSATVLETTDTTLPPSSDSQSTRPIVKSRRSVQFADLPLVNEPELMGEMVTSPISRPKRLKSPPMPSDPSQPPPKPRSILRKLSVTDYQSRSAGQNFEKVVVLGPSGTKGVQMTFENIRSDSDPWHSHFVKKDSLHFSRTLNALTFTSQIGSIVGPNLSHGAVRPTLASDHEVVSRAAERLRLGPFGVACFHEEFLIIIYPADCEDWKKVIAGAEASDPATVTLTYAIFKPQPIAAKPLPAKGSWAPRSTEPRITILRDLLRLNYRQLLSPGMRDIHHNFYLAFPPSRKLLLDAVSKWLHVENPTCRVFSTKTAGDWAAFTNPKIVPQGVIIVHEAATDTLRQFPGLLRLLIRSKSTAYVFWCIGESLQQHPLYPSIRSMHHQTEPGKVELTRFFPHGNAILVTPSFLVSEPQRAHQLFEWYKRTHEKPYNNQKIVVAANILDYLRDLAFERSNRRDKLLTEGGKKRQRSDAEQEQVARKAGLSKEDCAARFNTWAIVEGLRLPAQTSIVPDEQLEPVVFADQSIDANDEQSLVNWFGCWSQTRFDQFRKFHVLGTDSSSDTHHFIKACDIPLYPPGAGRDPGAEPRGDAPLLEPTASDPDHPHQFHDGVTKMLGGLAAHFFSTKLMELAKECDNARWCPFAKLYGFPVSYFKDIADTADSYGDFYRKFATFERWLEFSWPFFAHYLPTFRPPSDVRGPPVFNTYFSLFYTPDEDSQCKPPTRHPWLAIWRVQAPHRPWEGTELLIWDIAAKDRFPTGDRFYESQLISPQQHLIGMIREKGAAKHRGLDLKQVWIGGFDSVPTEYTSPIDVTLANLEAMMRDVKGYLPAVESLLSSRGFHKIYPGAAPAPRRPITPDAMDVDPVVRHQNHNGDSKIIFHPPRACRPIRHSRCENLFYKWVTNLDRRDKREAYPYTFKPTLDWYQEQQVAENRNFEHINVSSWKRVFELVRTSPAGGKDSEETRVGSKQ